MKAFATTSFTPTAVAHIKYWRAITGNKTLETGFSEKVIHILRYSFLYPLYANIAMFRVYRSCKFYCDLVVGGGRLHDVRHIGILDSVPAAHQFPCSPPWYPFTIVLSLMADMRVWYTNTFLWFFEVHSQLSLRFSSSARYAPHFDRRRYKIQSNSLPTLSGCWNSYTQGHKENRVFCSSSREFSRRAKRSLFPKLALSRAAMKYDRECAVEGPRISGFYGETGEDRFIFNWTRRVQVYNHLIVSFFWGACTTEERHLYRGGNDSVARASVVTTFQRLDLFIHMHTCNAYEAPSNIDLLPYAQPNVKPRLFYCNFVRYTWTTVQDMGHCWFFLSDAGGPYESLFKMEPSKVTIADVEEALLPYESR